MRHIRFQSASRTTRPANGRATAIAVVACLCITALASDVRAGDEFDDRVLWQFEFPTESSGQFVTVTDAGTIYVTDSTALYALTSDGELMWTLPGAGGGRPIPVAGDGTIYTGSNDIKAINPDGSLKWQYTPPDNLPLLAGPSIGPDGNLYAVQDHIISTGDGLGAFSVDPDGELRWSNVGEPEIFDTSGGTNSEILFGDEAMFVGLVGASGPPSTRAFDLSDGEQLWFTGDLGHSADSMPRMLPDGRLIFNLGQTGLIALHQDGSKSWSAFHPDGVSTLTIPAVGPDGMIYTGDWLGLQLWKVTSDGQTVLIGDDTGDTVNRLAVSPDNETLLVDGGGSFGETGWVWRYDPADGSLQWNVNLPKEEGMMQLVNTIRPRFTDDGGTVYVTSTFAGDVVGHSYLYALDLTDARGEISGDLNGDDVVDVSDLLILLGQWSACADCADCQADLNDDCTVDVSDLLILLSNWG